ncbi:ATP-binding protein [Methanobrevibacter filiformis]|uniref:Putative AAA-ATPase n=1 Tax=Methanobrevibacter filiformis TaxID=55758 RepID=A0A166FD59_9EURY|nr:ATP-binding protein [Methanobrevibacter filiformis]KZX17555.1 putative AAA-ATPase [Methanobrevibacter filiformis]
MNNIKGDLSTDISDFKKLINRDKIYVDKTDIIKRMMDLRGTYHFLARPRRFGKSLLISTLNELFKGNKELFKGLYIYDNWDWNDIYPVIHLDFSEVDSENHELFEETLNFTLDRIAKNFSTKLDAKHPNIKIKELIEELYIKYNKEVVVLIDEYDKPILDILEDKTSAISVQKKLKKFFGALKSADSYLRFVFITGISKFSKGSIFSDFNNLTDLTLNKDYSTICGYTDDELEKYFKKFIDNYSSQENISYEETLSVIKQFYDGYSWDGKNFLYNPYSLVHFFNENQFKNFWFESGTPNFLVKIFKENLNIDNVYEPIISSEADFNVFDIENLRQIPLLFQSGYLTINKIETINYRQHYTLRIPNTEVEESITKNIFDNFYNEVEYTFKLKRKEILNQLKDGNCQLLSKYLKKEIMSIHYLLKMRNWKYYQTVILFAMKALNLNTRSEVGMFSGRMDIVIEEEDNYYSFHDGKGHIIIMEVKYTQKENKDLETLANKALKQIKEKEYYGRYEYEKLVLIGIAIKEIKLSVGSKIDLKCAIEKI